MLAGPRPDRQLALQTWLAAWRAHESAAFDAADDADAATLHRTLDYLLDRCGPEADPGQLVLSVPESWRGVVLRFIIGRLETPEDDWFTTSLYKGAHVQTSPDLAEGLSRANNYENEALRCSAFIIPSSLPTESLELFLTLREDGTDEAASLALCMLLDAAA